MLGDARHRRKSSVTMSETPFRAAVAQVRAGEPVDAAVAELLAQLTPEAKLGLLDRDLPFWEAMADMLANGYNRTPYPMGRIDRLGIPGLLFSDGPRGV